MRFSIQFYVLYLGYKSPHIVIGYSFLCSLFVDSFRYIEHGEDEQGKERIQCVITKDQSQKSRIITL